MINDNISGVNNPDQTPVDTTNTQPQVVVDVDSKQFAPEDSGSNSDQNSKSSAKPLKTFKKSSQKKSSVKYIVLLILIFLLGTAGVLFVIEQQKDTPVPTVPESEPEAAIEFPCTLSFEVPTPTPEPTPVPIHPQCTTISLGQMSDEGFVAIGNLQSLERGQVVDIACYGNQPVEPGGVAITKMEFRELQKNLCLPGESCPGHQELALGGVTTFNTSNHIITGILENYEVKLGVYALQCRICTGVDGANCQPWDSTITWPDGSDYEQEDDASVCPQESQTEITISALPGIPPAIVATAAAPIGYTDIELRITTVDEGVLSFRDADIITSPTIQWLWPELDVSYENIVSATFFINTDPSVLGSGGLRCGTWTPTNQDPTIPTNTPTQQPTATPRANVTLVPTTYEDPSPGGCKISECGDYRSLRCIGTESLVCIRDEDGVCGWQCEPNNIR